MGKLRNDFNFFKEQQVELNQSLTQRLRSLEDQNKNTVRRFYENNEQSATVVQISNILEKLISFDDRIKRLEDPDTVNNQVTFVFILKPTIQKLKLKKNFKDQNTSKVKQLIEISKKFASASTVIGFTRTVRAETKVMKICWVLMTLISLAFGLYLTSGTIKEYLEYDVFTQTKLVQATPSLIPSITFVFGVLTIKI